MPTVENKRDRSVVHQLHFHMRPKETGGHRQISRRTKGGDKVIEEATGDVGGGGLVEPGTATLSRIAQQCKLRNGQQPATEFGERTIHLAGLIAKNAKCGNLLHQVGHIRFRIALGHPDQHDQAGPDLADGLSVHLDGGTDDALDYRSHEVIGNWSFVIESEHVFTVTS